MCVFFPGTNYKEDLRTIIIRCEALETESAGISSHLQQLQTEIEQERKQVKNINKEEQRTLDEIKVLQQRLNDYQEHKAEYEKKCGVLEKKYSDDCRKLALVQQTLRGLKKDAEKVKMFCPFLCHN